MNPLIERMSARTGHGKKTCGVAVARLAEDIAHVLDQHGECRLPGIGTLKVTERAARTGRNPKTGEPVDIPARKTVRFSPAKGLKDALND